MSNNIVQLPSEIKQEFRIDEQGKITTSIRGAARLADIDEKALRYGLKIDAKQTLPKLAVFLINNGFEGAELNTWIETGIPDIALALILEYYAYECQERYRKEQAKKFCRAFRAIGFRTWTQQQLGWQQPNPQNQLTQDLMLADYAARTVQEAGITKDIAQQIKLQTLIQAYPTKQHILQPHKDAIAAHHPLPETPLTPTQIGQKLATDIEQENFSLERLSVEFTEEQKKRQNPD